MSAYTEGVREFPDGDCPYEFGTCAYKYWWAGYTSCWKILDRDKGEDDDW